MNIKSTFNVGDFAQFKINRPPKNYINALQIMEIHTTTCYSATQIFYFVNEVGLQKEFENKYNKDSKFEWIRGKRVDKLDDFKLGWIKVREDELISVSKEILKLLIQK